MAAGERLQSTGHRLPVDQVARPDHPEAAAIHPEACAVAPVLAPELEDERIGERVGPDRVGVGQAEASSRAGASSPTASMGSAMYAWKRSTRCVASHRGPSSRIL